MSGIGFSELLILCLIGLIVLGPKRLPKVANQIGGWVGQARRMTRVMRRQLEEELDFDKELNIKPTIHKTPNDDDTFSPLHSQPSKTTASVEVESGDEEEMPDEAPDEAPAENDDSERKEENRD